MEPEQQNKELKLHGEPVNKSWFKKYLPIIILVVILISVGSLLAAMIFSGDAEENMLTQREQFEHEIDTSDWKTFQDTENNYSFKYPARFADYIYSEKVLKPLDRSPESFPITDIQVSDIPIDSAEAVFYEFVSSTNYHNKILEVSIDDKTHLEIVYTFKGVSDVEPPTSAELEQIAKSVSVISNWRTYHNDKFDYSISYPQDQFSIETEFGEPVESATRDIGVLKLKEEHWSKYSDLVGSKPQVSWIVNKNIDSINDECVRYSEDHGLQEMKIANRNFIVREVTAGNDIGEGGSYYKRYNYRGEEGCFLISASIGLKDYKVNTPEVNPSLKELMNELEKVVKTFEIN